MSDLPFDEVGASEPDVDPADVFTLDDDELETSEDTDFEDVEDDLADIPF